MPSVLLVLLVLSTLTVLLGFELGLLVLPVTAAEAAAVTVAKKIIGS
ncbi:hypothetical protein ACFWIA_13040 [Streptomyces sp. NPDC127068]